MLPSAFVARPGDVWSQLFHGQTDGSFWQGADNSPWPSDNRKFSGRGADRVICGPVLDFAYAAGLGMEVGFHWRDGHGY